MIFLQSRLVVHFEIFVYIKINS